jgi:hypothetical protein
VNLRRAVGAGKMADLVEFAVLLLVISAAAVHAATMTNARRRNLVDDTLCPAVKPMRDFDIARVGFYLLV